MAKNHKPAGATRELRTYAASPLEIRTTADGSKQVSGYAIVFNSASVDLGGFTEICAPAMLTRTLRENPDVIALRDHKQELLIGRTTAGTLSLRVDTKGLAFTVTLPKTAIGDDTAENVRLRNLTGVSFGFNTVEDSWAADAQGNVVRTLLDVDLFEISITSFPAYEATSVNTRSCPVLLRNALKSKRDFGTDEDNEDDCGCECQGCIDDMCELCSADRCTDTACADCPMQTRDDDDEDEDDDDLESICDPDSDEYDEDLCNSKRDARRADALRIRQLFAHRIKALNTL